MKILYILILISISISVTGQKLSLRTDKTTVRWIGYGEIGNFKQEGSIKAKKGSLIIEDNLITSAEITIDMNSIYHTDKSLAKHLSQKDFFWSKKYPTATLKMLTIKDDVIKAELKIKNKTYPITFPVTIERTEDSVLVSGKITIDRTRYGIKYNSSTFFQNLGNYAIKNEFDLSFAAIFN